MSALIRLAHELDAAAVAAIYRPFVETTAVSFETVAPDQEEMRRRIADTTASHPWLVCELDGVLAGYAYATRHRVRAAYQWSVDTSVYEEALFSLGREAPNDEYYRRAIRDYRLTN